MTYLLDGIFVSPEALRDIRAWAGTFIDIQGKYVLVTGGSGFLGQAVRKMLESRGAFPIWFNRETFNLLSYDETLEALKRSNPDYIIHCAGYNGGIEFNRKYPADILYNNVVMGLNLHRAVAELNQAYNGRVEKIVNVMTSCAYPDTGMEVLNEKDYWNGLPNETIRSHGHAKRILQAASEAYKKQYNLNSVSVVITNLYGPNDTFDLVRTKVVGALIRKFVEAKQQNLPSVACWGTGKPLREFMYVDDAAEALVQVLERYSDNQTPLNIGTGKEITIRELTELIVELTDYKGEVVWDVKKGDGQMKKLLDVSKMKTYLDVNPVDIKHGLKATIDWYVANKEFADGRK